MPDSPRDYRDMSHLTDEEYAGTIFNLLQLLGEMLSERDPRSNLILGYLLRGAIDGKAAYSSGSTDDLLKKTYAPRVKKALGDPLPPLPPSDPTLGRTYTYNTDAVLKKSDEALERAKQRLLEEEKDRMYRREIREAMLDRPLFDRDRLLREMEMYAEIKNDLIKNRKNQKNGETGTA